MHELKNIVFDFGGVLVDWNPKQLYRGVFETEAEADFFIANICTYEWHSCQDAGRSLAEGTAWLCERHPEYAREIEMYYGRWNETLIGEFEQNVRLILPLKEKYAVYGLTNWPAETIPAARERFEFFSQLDGIVVSGEEKLRKPDPALFNVLLDRYSLNAHESLFIDDSAANIETAASLGFRTIHYTPDVNLEATLKAMNIIP